MRGEEKGVAYCEITTLAHPPVQTCPRTQSGEHICVPLPVPKQVTMCLRSFWAHIIGRLADGKHALAFCAVAAESSGDPA